MDFRIYKALNGFAFHHDGWEDVAKAFEHYAPVILAVLLAGLFLARGRLASVAARRGVVAASVSAGLALVLAKVISDAVARQRPFVDHPHVAHLFAKHAADYGFPSDHTSGAFAIAVALLLRHRVSGWVALVLATLIGVGRVMIGVHYPSDVVAGAVLGTLCALVFWHPRLRGYVDALADWLSSIYDRIAAAVLRRPARTVAART